MLPGEGQLAETIEHRRPPATCPECLKEYEDPRKLAFHLERHREVRPPVFSPRGEARSTPCPKGCGRHFGDTRNFREHVPLCKGEPPISREQSRAERQRREDAKIAQALEAQREREEDARGRDQAAADAIREERKEQTMVKCDECGKQCANGTGLSAHMRGVHGAKKKRERPGGGRREQPTSTSPGDGLRIKAVIYRQQAEELNKKADQLEELAKQADALL